MEILPNGNTLQGKKNIMIVLNTFWNKEYIQNGLVKCWVMALKSSTKKGS